MAEDLRRYPQHPQPTPDRPLLGITVLVVEDSRFASEAIRLMCLRSGARMRRADSLAAAHRHLSVYRPTVVIADMGLPDGSGADLIRELALASPRVPALIGSSGDTGGEAAARQAGADGFLAKPVENLGLFQQTILSALGAELAPRGPRAVPSEAITPDPLALADDPEHASQIIGQGAAGAAEYVAQFLGAVARSAHDPDLAAAARLGRGRAALGRLAGLVDARLAALRAG